MQVIFLFIAFQILSPSCDVMSKVRESYGNIKSEKELESFIALLESADCLNTEPYMASAVMQKAQFALAPWTKYNYFLSGKHQLEAYIQKYPKDLEARYIRFLIQSHAPFFLGYNREKDGDVKMILAEIDDSGLPETYILQIKSHINQFNK